MNMRRRIIFMAALIAATAGALLYSGGAGRAAQESGYKPLTEFEGKIVFHSNFDGDNEIYVLDKKGLVKLTNNSWNDEYPVWSPDGSRIAYSADPDGNYDIHVMNADGSEAGAVTSFTSDEKEPSWYPDGNRIAYSREIDRLLRDKISLYKVNLREGKSAPLIPRYGKTHAIPDISPTEPLVTFTQKRLMGWDAALYNLKTGVAEWLDDGGKSCRARFSPDGTMLAYVSSKADGKGDIWLMKTDGSGKRRLTERDETYDYFPSWSPDGRFIVFNSSTQHDHNGDWQLWIVEVATGRADLLLDTPGNDVFPDWK
jgi:Tol biopolymer transport system component